MVQSETNHTQIDDMSSLVNDPQNKKMYRAVNRNRVSDTNKTHTIGMMQLPDNSTKTNVKSLMQAVTYFCIHSAVREVYRAGNKTCSDIIIVNCENIYSERFTVKIDYAMFSRKLIKSAFEEQSRNAVFSKDETAIFEDDAATKNRLSENIRFLYDACVKRRKFDNEIAECNCIILCSQA